MIYGVYIVETDALAQVATIGEVCHMWGKSKSGVYNALNKGHIKGRQSFAQRTTLIDVQSVIAYWGPPRRNLLEALKWQS